MLHQMEERKGLRVGNGEGLAMKGAMRRTICEDRNGWRCRCDDLCKRWFVVYEETVSEKAGEG